MIDQWNLPPKTFPTLRWATEGIQSIDQSAWKSVIKDESLLNLPSHHIRSYIDDLSQVVENGVGRKEQGSYYTPTALAQEMTAKAFATYSRNHEGKDVGPTEVRVLDPAVGAGQFLGTALEVMFQSNPDIGQSKIFSAVSKLHGVDINPLALDMAKLRVGLIAHQYLRRPLDQSVAKTLGQLDLSNIRLGNALLGWRPPNIPPQWAKWSREELDKRYRATIGTPDGQVGSLTSKLPIVLEPTSSAEHRLFHWPAEFDDPCFDVILGNPPYYQLRGSNAFVYPQLPEYKSMRSGIVLNTAVLFSRLMLDLLSPSGVLTFLVPKGLAYTHSFAKFRQYLYHPKHSFPLFLLINCQKAFKGVKLEQVVFGVSRKKQQLIEVMLYDPRSTQITPVTTLPADYFPTEEGVFFLDVNPLAVSVREKVLARSKRLSDVTAFKGNKVKKLLIYRGEGGTNTQVKEQAVEAGAREEGQTYWPVLWGERVRRGFVRPAYLQNLPKKMRARHEERYAPEKLVCQRIVAHVTRTDSVVLKAAVDKGSASVDTVMNIQFVTSKGRDEGREWSLESYTYLQAWFHSPVLNFFVHKFIFSGAIRSMDLSRSVLELFPVPMMTKAEQENLLSTQTLEEQAKVWGDWFGLSQEEQQMLRAYHWEEKGQI